MMSLGMSVCLSPAKPADQPLQQLLAGLYRQQQAQSPGDPYLLDHARPGCIANRVRTFHWYRPFLPASGTLLDWGCGHAPDSCLLRARFPNRFRLYSCDFAPRSRFQVFHDFADANYTQLEDDVRLPYPKNCFDAVIASGVLEHAATDYESLKELRRILKPGGVLVISYLPNWLSANECWRRNVRQRGFHHRLYGRVEAHQLLKHSGFYPLTARYQTFFWERLIDALGFQRWERGVSAWLRRVVPFQVFSSTHCLVARKERHL